MKKILICYFSGTGNTKKVVQKAYDSFEEMGCDVTLYNIDDGFYKDDLNQFDCLGIAYPIHAFNAPSNVIKFVKNLNKLNKDKKDKKDKKSSKKPLFIIKTSGEPLALNNISSVKIKSILKKKGFVLNNEYHYCMPYNIIFRHSDNMAYKMWKSAENVLPIDCKEIIEGKKSKLKYFPCGRLLAWIFRIEHWGGRVNGKHYKVNDKCISCQLCVKRCPTQNITIEDGEFKFGKNCLMCMRCSFHCPKNSIKIGWFEKWKVNGPYNFNNPNEGEEERHKKYCKKSYKKYFARMDKKLENNKSFLESGTKSNLKFDDNFT